MLNKDFLGLLNSLENSTNILEFNFDDKVSETWLNRQSIQGKTDITGPRRRALVSRGNEAVQCAVMFILLDAEMT